MPNRYNYINAGVIFISDSMFSQSNVESFNIVKDKGPISSSSQAIVNWLNALDQSDFS